MSCHTQEEITERENIDKAQVSRICCETAELPERNKPAANHMTDFDVPIWSEKFLRTKSTKPSVIEFLNSLQVGENGIGAENADSSENPELTQDIEQATIGIHKAGSL